MQKAMVAHLVCLVLQMWRTHHGAAQILTNATAALSGLKHSRLNPSIKYGITRKTFTNFSVHRTLKLMPTIDIEDSIQQTAIKSGMNRPPKINLSHPVYPLIKATDAAKTDSKVRTVNAITSFFISY